MATRFRAARLRELLAQVDPNPGRQNRLARRLGVARQTVSEWINGRRQPGGSLLVNLASYLGTTADDLLPPDVQSTAAPAAAGDSAPEMRARPARAARREASA